MDKAGQAEKRADGGATATVASPFYLLAMASNLQRTPNLYGLETKFPKMSTIQYGLSVIVS